MYTSAARSPARLRSLALPYTPAAAVEPSYEWPTSVDVNLPLHLSHPAASARALCTAPISLSVPPHPHLLHLRLLRLFLLLHRRHTRPPRAPTPPAPCLRTPLTNCFVGGAKKRRRAESERGGEEGGREREGGRKKKEGGGWERGSERKCERERGKLGLDEKMLRPVALHTRGHQIKSLVVSPAHPSVRSRASERKIKKIKKEKRTERGSEREKKKRERPAGGGGAFMVYLGARGTFYRKRHRFFPRCSLGGGRVPARGSVRIRICGLAV